MVSNPRRVAKKDTTNVWIVEIKMPRRFVDESAKNKLKSPEDSYIDMEAVPRSLDQSLDNPNTMSEVDPTATGLQEPRNNIMSLREEDPKGVVLPKISSR